MVYIRTSDIYKPLVRAVAFCRHYALPQNPTRGKRCPFRTPCQNLRPGVDALAKQRQKPHKGGAYMQYIRSPNK